MSLIVDKNNILPDIYQFIKITTTYYTDPKYPFKENCYELRDDYKIIVNQAKYFVTKEMIDFVLNILFKPLNIMIEKYIGKNDCLKKSEIRFYRVVNNLLILPLHYGKLLLNQKDINCKYPPNRGNFTGSLLERQIKIIDDIEFKLKTYNTVVLNLYPGFGKTTLATYLACWSKILTCIIINMRTQIEQWKSTFEKNTDCNVWIVGENDANIDPDYVDVIICMAERFDKIPDNLRLSVGHLIIDEAHLLCTPGHSLIWLSFYPKYLTILTATLIRPDDSMEKMIYAAAGDKSIISIKNPKEFKFYIHYTGCKSTMETRNNMVDYTKHIQSLINNDSRNQKIVNLISTSLDYERKILCLTKEKSHIELLAEKLKSENLEFSSFFGNMKNYLDSNILLGTYPKIGTGFDEATFCKTFNGKRLDRLIMCFTIKKFSTFEQTIGRVMRSDCPDVFVLIDDNPIARRHLFLMIWFITEYTNGKIIGNY